MCMFKHYSKLKERKIKTKTLYSGVVDFKVDSVRLINGKTAKREYLDHPGAAAVLPIIGDKVVLVQQYRYPIAQTTWELPAGKLKPGQTPLAAAKAELKEETGYTAGKIKKLIFFNPAAAFSSETVRIFIATNLKPGPTKPDQDEFLNIKLWPLKQAYKMVEDGTIKDSKTIIALLMYRNYCLLKKKIL